MKRSALCFLLGILLFTLFSGLLVAEEPAKKLIIGTFEAPPYSIKNSLGLWEGVGIDLWKATAQKLGLVYEFVEIPEREALKRLESHEIDLVAGGLAVTVEGERLIDYSQVFYTSDLAIAVPHRPKANYFLSLVRVFFSWQFLQVFLGVIAVLLIAGSIIWVVEHKHNPEYFGNQWLKGVFTGLYWSAAMMSGCGDAPPRSVHGRILGLTWIFGGVFLISSFTAAITSVLTAEQLSFKIVSKKDLPHAQVGYAQKVHEELFEKMGVKASLYPTETRCLESVLNRESDACVSGEMLLRYLAQRDHKNKFDIIPMPHERVFYAFGFPHGSPLEEKINRSILEILSGPEWDDVIEKYLGNQ